MPSITLTRANGETHTISGASDEELYIELGKEAPDRLAMRAGGEEVEGEGRVEFRDLVPTGAETEVGRGLFYAPANEGEDLAALLTQPGTTLRLSDGRTFAATARLLAAFTANVSRWEVFEVRLFAREVA